MKLRIQRGINPTMFQPEIYVDFTGPGLVLPSEIAEKDGSLKREIVSELVLTAVKESLDYWFDEDEKRRNMMQIPEKDLEKVLFVLDLMRNKTGTGTDDRALVDEARKIVLTAYGITEDRD